MEFHLVLHIVTLLAYLSYVVLKVAFTSQCTIKAIFKLFFQVRFCEWSCFKISEKYEFVECEETFQNSYGKFLIILAFF